MQVNVFFLSSFLAELQQKFSQLLGFKITGEVASASPDETSRLLDPSRLDTSAVESGLDITVFIDWQAAMGVFVLTAEGIMLR